MQMYDLGLLEVWKCLYAFIIEWGKCTYGGKYGAPSYEEGEFQFPKHQNKLREASG